MGKHVYVLVNKLKESNWKYLATEFRWFGCLVQAVHDMGARKFVLFGVQAIGCTPFARAASGMKDGYCREEMNNAAISFNRLLSSSLVNLETREMPGSRIVYVDTYKIIRDVFNDPSPLGMFLSFTINISISIIRSRQFHSNLSFLHSTIYH